jgi:hypothetical protein
MTNVERIMAERPATHSLRVLLPTALALLAGAACAAGGIRLALQGDWGWGAAIAIAGGWIVLRTLMSYRATRDAADTDDSIAAPPADPRRGGRR